MVSLPCDGGLGMKAVRFYVTATADRVFWPAVHGRKGRIVLEVTGIHTRPFRVRHRPGLSNSGAGRGPYWTGLTSKMVSST